jgi:hypothetical protein
MGANNDGGDELLRRIWAEKQVYCCPVEGKKRWNFAGHLDDLRRIKRGEMGILIEIN